MEDEITQENKNSCHKKSTYIQYTVITKVHCVKNYSRNS